MQIAHPILVVVAGLGGALSGTDFAEWLAADEVSEFVLETNSATQIKVASQVTAGMRTTRMCSRATSR